MKQICDRNTRKQLYNTVKIICSKKITVIIIQMLLPHLRRQKNGNIFCNLLWQEEKDEEEEVPNIFVCA